VHENNIKIYSRENSEKHINGPQRDLSNTNGKWKLKWLNISDNVWLSKEDEIQGGNWVPINTPGIDHCAAVLLPL